MKNQRKPRRGARPAAPDEEAPEPAPTPDQLAEEEDPPPLPRGEDADLDELGARIEEPAPGADREPLRSGGVRRGEPMTAADEEDDFEDGRSSAGTFSRAREDLEGRGDLSRDLETRTGWLSVERGPDTTRGAEPPAPDRAPDEGRGFPEARPRRSRRPVRRGRARKARGARRRTPAS